RAFRPPREKAAAGAARPSCPSGGVRGATACPAPPPRRNPPARARSPRAARGWCAPPGAGRDADRLRSARAFAAPSFATRPLPGPELSPSSGPASSSPWPAVYHGQATDAASCRLSLSAREQPPPQLQVAREDDGGDETEQPRE